MLFGPRPSCIGCELSTLTINSESGKTGDDNREEWANAAENACEARIDEEVVEVDGAKSEEVSDRRRGEDEGDES